MTIENAYTELSARPRRGARRIGRGLRALAIGVGASWIASASFAAGLEDLISPGALIEAHQREVKACSDCHQSFERRSQGQLCLVCHEDVGGDLSSGQGFHGRLGKGSQVECSVCHSEHKGDDADITGLVAESFDHRRTDFVLEGAHAGASCGGCHESGAPHREAKSDCVACHQDDDPHRGKLGDRCEDCHAAEGWKSVSFDHAETRFPLEGKHEETSCASCHPGQRFESVSMDCVACHGGDDVHRGRLGPACADCHDSSGWKRPSFDHARKTKSRFALTGAHGRLECSDCHKSKPEEVKLPTDCAGCHRLDDDHRGSRGSACADCHGTSTWGKSRFDHGRDARFALHGAHADISCELCHEGGAVSKSKKKTPKRCVECHETSDVHLGSLGSDCTACHNEASWNERVVFDHDLTDFPLLSLHQLVSCEDCHVSHRFGEAAPNCVACHTGDDAHERRLGNDCERCHDPNGWRRWLFDHASQTGFELAGGHDGVQCVDCHLKPTSGSSDSLEVSERCSSCHMGDSPHDDAFGRDCERCHVDDSWKRTIQGVR